MGGGRPEVTPDTPFGLLPPPTKIRQISEGISNFSAMQRTFTIYFRKKRQWADIFLWDVHPNTFANWKAGRWGYWIATWSNPKSGKFGEIHLVESRVREDLISHELDHLRLEWLFANRVGLGVKNEEWYCSFGDELTRKFWREYKKYKRRLENG